MWLKGFDNISYAALCTAALSPTDPHNTAVPDQAIRRARGLPSPHARLCGVRLRSSGGMQTLEAESLLNSSLMGSRAGMGSSWVRHDTQGFTYPAFTDGCGSDWHDYMRRGVGGCYWSHCFIYLLLLCVNLSVFEVSLCAKSRLIIDLMLFIKQQTTMFLQKATFLAIMNFNHIHEKQSKGLEIVISV